MIGLVDGNNFFVSCERVIDPSLNGKAVAVLSNNDGCCVSRSNEFKRLGIPMGTPYFKLKDRARTGELIFRSSNFELYGDLSRRIVSILRDVALDVQQYSIDEAFVLPPPEAHLRSLFPLQENESPYFLWGKFIRSRILKWVGIPCGVGFAPTKTLAKIANHIAKKTTDGVFVLPEDPTNILTELPIEEVWGIGRKMSVRLHAEGVHTAEQFRQMDDTRIQRLGSVTTLRTAWELRGRSLITDRDYDAAPESVTCSRCFGSYVTTSDALHESFAYFAAQGAQKLRKFNLRAAGCTIFVQIGSALEHQFADRLVSFPFPTSATHEILHALRSEVEALFMTGARYRKSGLVFWGLEPNTSFRQGNLFVPTLPRRDYKKLYQVVDAINTKLGAGTLFTAAEGLAEKRNWMQKRDMLSPRATTNWNELLRVYAK